MSKHIFWIASYPKSGNTLLRAIISSLFFSKDGYFDFKILKHTTQFEMRKRLDVINEINKNDFLKIGDLKILSKYWQLLQSKKNLNINKGFGFVKSHSNLVSLFNNWFTTPELTAGYIYVIRDPRDIAISWSKHSGLTLDKSIVNGIRRTLLTDIKSIAMNPDHIIIDKNSGSLHNEFLKHRISLIPLYIDPENYNNSLLFELKVKMDDNPTMNIYSNNFNIYPLKNEYMNALKNEDIDTIEMLINPNKSYYNLN